MNKTLVVNKYKSEFDVYIGRGSIWGNPFTSKPLESTKAEHQCSSREESIAKFKEWLLNQPNLISQVKQLIGKRLACFCKPQACHGDVLAEIADWNAPGIPINFKTLITVKDIVGNKEGILLPYFGDFTVIDCTTSNCIDLHTEIKWNDGTSSYICINDLVRISESEFIKYN